VSTAEIGFQALLRWLLFPAIAIPVCLYARSRGHCGFVERLGAWFLIIPVALGASFLGHVAFLVLLAACGVVAAWELARLGQPVPPGAARGLATLAVSPARFVAALVCSLPWLFWAGRSPAFPIALALLAATAPLALFLALPRATAVKWSVPLLPLSLGASLSFWVLLQREPAGFRWVLLAFSVVVMNDVMGFLTGRFVPGPHPFPGLSPGKTVTGYAGGIVSGILVAFILAFAVPEFGTAELAAAGLLLACSGAAGDLVASAVKRRHSAKDFSRALGAQGGMLDRLDSLLGAGWAFYLFLRFVTG